MKLNVTIKDDKRLDSTHDTKPKIMVAHRQAVLLSHKGWIENMPKYIAEFGCVHCCCKQ